MKTGKRHRRGRPRPQAFVQRGNDRAASPRYGGRHYGSHAPGHRHGGTGTEYARIEVRPQGEHRNMHPPPGTCFRWWGAAAQARSRGWGRGVDRVCTPVVFVFLVFLAVFDLCGWCFLFSTAPTYRSLSTLWYRFLPFLSGCGMSQDARFELELHQRWRQLGKRQLGKANTLRMQGEGPSSVDTMSTTFSTDPRCGWQLVLDAIRRTPERRVVLDETF